MGRMSQQSRPIKEGETLTATPDTDGQTGTPVTAMVDKKAYNGTEQHNSNQPTSDSLPQTGTNDSIFVVFIGLLITLLSGLLFFRKKEM